MNQPVLNVILKLLTLKKGTTLAEIASVSGKKKADILNILHDNRALLKVVKGRIVWVELEKAGWKTINQQSYYEVEFSKDKKIITFEGAPELKVRLGAVVTTSLWGRIFSYLVVEATESNLQEIEKAGFKRKVKHTKKQIIAMGCQIWKEVE